MNTNAKRRPIIAANWKLHKTIAEATQFIDDLQRQYAASDALDVVLAAPFTMLAAMREHVEGGPYLAAQDVFWEAHGPHTGEVSAPMLYDVGCTYVIIGHSERRQRFGETDENVAKKVTAALQAGLHPIICIGESLAQRQAEATFAILEQQVRQGLASCQVVDLSNLVLAYEPLWAIGTGVTATPAQAQEVHQFIRTLLGKLWGTEAAQTVRLQYGGSVNASNINVLMAENDIDGALVGGASLEIESFIDILSYRRNCTC
ncbi:MAG: triose-phosphate isomerase [bacterium]|nr:triose-phosphate isomerase [bacterium]